MSIRHRLRATLEARRSADICWSCALGSRRYSLTLGLSKHGTSSQTRRYGSLQPDQRSLVQERATRRQASPKHHKRLSLDPLIGTFTGKNVNHALSSTLRGISSFATLYRLYPSWEEPHSTPIAPKLHKRPCNLDQVSSSSTSRCGPKRWLHGKGEKRCLFTATEIKDVNLSPHEYSSLLSLSRGQRWVKERLLQSHEGHLKSNLGVQRRHYATIAVSLKGIASPSVLIRSNSRRTPMLPPTWILQS